MVMDGGKSSKRRAEARPEGQSSAKRQNVTMGLDTLDCPVCSKPLSPPIFQCAKGNFICSPCCEKLPERERAAPKRCYGMERVVNSIFVPCKHRCATNITSYQKKEHEERCPTGPCFCPVSGCSFAGKTALLLDHLTTLHKFPTKTFKYFVPFDLSVQPGSIVLRGGYGRLLLLEMASLESLGHSVSLVCATRNPSIGTIRSSVGFSCFEGHYQLSSLEVGCSSLSDELPAQYLCVMPKVSGEQTDVVLRITIDLFYDHQVEPEEEDDDDDGSYNQEEDETMTTKWRMVVSELVLEKYADDNIYVEEDHDNSSEEDDDEDTITTTRTSWVITMTNNKDEDADDHNSN